MGVRQAWLSSFRWNHRTNVGEVRGRSWKFKLADAIRRLVETGLKVKQPKG
jgi:hypothetical protein